MQYSKKFFCRFTENTKTRTRGLQQDVINLKNQLDRRMFCIHHHMSDQITYLIKSLYSDYQLTIVTDSYVTSPTTVSREVLQGG